MIVIMVERANAQMSSPDFALKLQNIMQENSTITFVVGGSFGVSEKVKAKCNETVSFSKMTFPHNLFRS